MSNKRAKQFSDVISFAYWIRRSSIIRYKKVNPSFETIKTIGRGVIFHIAPSNVAVNYAYSLVTGMVTGNINIVRVPSRKFEQIDVINDTLKDALEYHPIISDYICLIRYGHDICVNDYLSSLADVRIIWGGDNTINTIRTSPMKPRSNEIVFADRYSIAVIDSDFYESSENKDEIALRFYNDTYLTDQNACSSPKVVIWVGDKKEYSKNDFWNRVHSLVVNRYNFQQIMGVDKLLKTCIVATKLNDSKIIKTKDNLLTRLSIVNLESEDIQTCFGNSGFFLEYDAKSIEEIVPLCDNTKCQTISYVGNIRMFNNIFNSGFRGIDRIVPFGKTMDYDLIWDGYDLISSLTRTIMAIDR